MNFFVLFLHFIHKTREWDPIWGVFRQTVGMHKVKTSQFRDTKAVAAPYPTDASYEGKQEKIKGVVRTLQTISKPKLFLNIKIIFKLFIHLREEVGLIPISTGQIFFFFFLPFSFSGKNTSD